MAKTKIVVIQMKELIYTAIFAGLGILLIVLLIIMFLPDKSNKEKTGSTKQIYTPGVYTSQIKLGDTTLNLEVAVDADQIKSVALVNLEESVTTMYPLVKPSLESIEKELIAGTKLEDVPLSDKSKYTESLLIEGIRTALNKAVTNPSIAVDLYNTISKYMVTDIDITKFTYLASEALGYNFDISHLYTMQGETLMGDKYEEFYVDDDALYQLIIDVFYEPVESEDIK